MTTYKSELIEFRAGRIILTEAEWTANANVYPEGIVAITSDGSNAGRTKVFDGVKYWSQLSYSRGGGGGAVTSDDVSNESDIDGATVTAALNAAAFSLTENNNAIAELATAIGVIPLVYNGLISQAGDTRAPTAVVLKSSLGTIIWTRFNTGQYLGTLVGAFPNNKTFILFNAPLAEVGEEYAFSVKRVSDDVVSLNVYNAAFDPIDGLFNASLQIQIYP